MPIGTLFPRAILATILALFVSAAAATDFPNRPITMLVGFAPGGATDLVARIVAQRLSERIGQSVVVENRPGAGGSVATALAAKAPPDGYTLLMASNSHAINGSLYKALPYDSIKDFEPVAACVSLTDVLAVHPALPASTVAEFIALAKAQPGSINMASAGAGSSSHLSGELFNNMAGIQTVHVPYKGTADALRDLVRGEVQVIFASLSGLLPSIRSGSLRVLGVGDPSRSKLLPDVPTISEAGLPGYELNGWTGLLAPAGLSPEIADRLHREVNDILRQPDVVKQLENLGARPTPISRPQFSQVIRSDSEHFANLIKSAGVKPQ